MHLIKRFIVVLIGCMALALYTGCTPEMQVEKEPNNTLSTPNRFIGTVVEGEISPAGDKDYWSIKLQKNNKYTFTLSKLTDDLQLMLYVFPETLASWDISLSTYQELSDTNGTKQEQITLSATENWNIQLLVEGSNTNAGDETSKYRLAYDSD